MNNRLNGTSSCAFDCVIRLIRHCLQQTKNHCRNHHRVAKTPVEGEHEDDDHDVQDPKDYLFIDFMEVILLLPKPDDIWRGLVPGWFLSYRNLCRCGCDIVIAARNLTTLLNSCKSRYLYMTKLLLKIFNLLKNMINS